MKSSSKIFVIILSFLLMFAGLPAEAFAASSMTELQASEFVLNNQMKLHKGTYYNGSIQAKAVENYIVYEPGRSITPLIAYGNDIYGAASIARVYEIEEAAGNHIVAASNGDYFTMATGVSIGTVIKNGTIRTGEHSSFETVGFWADGKAKIGRLSLAIQFTNERTGGSFSKINFNKTLTKDAGVVLYSGDFGDTNEAGLPSKNVVIDIESGETSPGGKIEGQIAYIADATGKLEIKDDQLVLSIASQTPYISVLETINTMNAGDAIELDFEVDSDWEDVYNAVGVERRLVNSGTVQTFTDTTRAPRTAIGIKADGDIVLYTVDGRQSSYSMGMTYAELAVRMKELGCVDAVNLDGGDSTMMFATYPGYEAKEQVNKSSGSVLRRCGNYILFNNNKTPTSTIKNIHVYPYNQMIMSGATMQLDVRASDSNYFYVKPPSSGITYSLSSESLGTITSDGLFTAGNKASTGTIKAKYSGISGSAAITVVSSPDSIAIVSSENGVEIPDKIAISAGEAFAFSATSIYKMLNILSDESSYRWSVSGNIGTIDEKGLFTATTTGLGTGQITATAGNKSDSVEVTIVTEGKLLENFENEDNLLFDIGHFENLTAEIETSSNYVHNGRKSLALRYQYDNRSVTTAEGAVEISSTDIVLPIQVEFSSKSPTMFSAWIYGDGSSVELQLNVGLSDGTETSVQQTLDFSGWRHIDFQLPKGVTSFKSVSIVTEGESVGKGVVYIDQMMAGFGYYLDSLAPVILAEVSGGVLIGSVTDNLDSEINQKSIEVMYDGKAVDFDYNASNKSLAALLPDGDGFLHRVVIKAVDLSGNIARYGVNVLTQSPDADFEKEDVFTDMSQAHWATQYAEYLYAQNIITGSISKDKRIYSPDNTMTRQEFAAVIVRWMGIDTEQYADVSLPFADYSKIQDWAKTSIQAALSLGFMTGKSMAGTDQLNFDPTGRISRQEVMTVIGRIQEKGYPEVEADFKDANKIASWALPYVKTLVAQGVVSGSNGLLDPTGPITRAQAAKIIFELN
ncbi:MAG: hypothetical protein EOM59_04535 [Clostridia bacterium]|nr:hypothetical protein [Clostridia bacterium]